MKIRNDMNPYTPNGKELKRKRIKTDHHIEEYAPAVVNSQKDSKL